MKKLINAILTIILIPMITLLILSFNLQTIIIDTISTSIVKEEIANNIDEIITDAYNINNEQIKKEIKENLENSNITQEITNEYLNSIIKSLESNDKNPPNINNYIEKIIDENEETLSEHNITLNEEQKNTIIAEINTTVINDTYEKIINNLDTNITSQNNNIIKLYNILISNTFKIILTILIAIDVLMIAIIKKSFYKWTYNLGIAGIINGIGLAIIYPLFSEIITNYLNKTTTYNFNINNQSITTSTYACITLSVILLIIYFICKQINKKEQNN